MVLPIDIVSDVICPWCYIGITRLEAALAERPSLATTVTFRPFLLDPTTPPEGADLRERLRAKYRVDPETMFGRVEAAARESGLALDFGKVRRTPNTLRAHTLMQKTLATPAQVPIAKALFAAYFLEGRDIGEVDVLVAIAAAHGVDEAAARSFLVDPAELEKTRAEALAASQSGISGVPFFVFAERYAVSGAQPQAVFVRALDVAAADAGPGAAAGESS